MLLLDCCFALHCLFFIQLPEVLNLLALIVQKYEIVMQKREGVYKKKGGQERQGRRGKSLLIITTFNI